MSNIIDSIRMSGTTYAISDSGGTKVVEITQSDYDNLPTSAKTANIMYVITDAEPFDVSNYYTKDETSGATELATAFAETQPKLSAGTNITIDANNVISAEGGGSITIDPTLDSGSTNAVANSAITTALNDTVKLSNLSTYYINGFTNYVNRIIPIFHRFDINNQSNGNAWWFGKINDKYVITTGQTSVTPSDLMNLQVVETSAITTSITSSSTDSQVPSAKAVYSIIPTSNTAFTNDAGYLVANDISGKTDTSAFTAHTADTTIHVTTAQTAAWNAKSDFSGNYNDLSNKPTIPTSASQLTNDSGYITSSALDGYATEAYVTAATNDMATKTWVGQQGYLTQHQDISGKQDVSGMTAYTTTATTNTLSGTVTAHTADTTIHVTAQDKTNWNNKSDFSGSYNDLTNKLSAGTNISIVDNVISAEGGGGKAIVAGRGISITTGETADTINCTLPISAGTGAYSAMLGQPISTSDASGSKTITGGKWSKAFSEGGVSIGQMNESRGQWAWAIGNITRANGKAAFACGDYTSANYQYAFSEGTNTTANTQASHAAGSYTSTKNRSEFSIGEYNNSVSASTTFGDSGNTLFSVGNGTSNNARHNAFEIRQNGDIYCSDGTNDVKLQDTITATAANTTALGGLKLVKLTQAEYDALATKDNSTLYIIIN